MYLDENLQKFFHGKKGAIARNARMMKKSQAIIVLPIKPRKRIPFRMKTKRVLAEPKYVLRFHKSMSAQARQVVIKYLKKWRSQGSIESFSTIGNILSSN
ncbi:MAG: hypothetical protein EBR94_01115 [Bacteroidetes bacterium]|nr:hypothetical protein [Bacteroidota bacterium]